jgi:nucleotide-binding universal stress UspA family protein
MNWMVGTIVVPSDGSSAAELQLASARALARTTGARVVVVHVTESESSVGEAISRHGGADARASRVRGQVDALRDAGVRAEVEILADGGDVACAIADTATKHAADLIVARPSRTGSSHRDASGDVAQRLIDSAACPVLVVPRAA